MKKEYLFFIVYVCTLIFSIAPISSAADPKPLDRSLEERIQKLKNLEIHQVVDELKKKDIYDDKVLFKNGVTVAFKNREKQAVEYIANYIKHPRYKYLGESVVENINFQISKRILQTFPDKSIGHIRQLYKDADTTTKGNIIEVLGTMPDSINGSIEKMLVKALDDKTLYEEEHSDTPGWPLRICDAAYNQLVLRLKIKNVIRTLGNTHDIDTRDYHITILKSRI